MLNDTPRFHLAPIPAEDAGSHDQSRKEARAITRPRSIHIAISTVIIATLFVAGLVGFGLI